MKPKLIKTCALMLMAVVFTSLGTAQTQSGESSKPKTTAKSVPEAQASGVNSPVVGSGTAGQLTRWTGFSGNTPAIGDSIITEDKSGKIGIGTTTPTSTLTVRGSIETTLGGFKFSDGSVQTTAAVSGLTLVLHDATLTGNGTSGSPLGIGVPLQLNGAVNQPILAIDNTGGGEGIFVSSVGANAVNGRSSTGVGVFGLSSDAAGVFGISSNKSGVSGDSTLGPGISGNSVTGTGVFGASTAGVGVLGQSEGSTGVHGISKVIDAPGVFGENTNNGDGVAGSSSLGAGVHGISNFNFGVFGESTTGTAVVGVSSNGFGVAGSAPAGLLAGNFQGDVRIIGDLTVAGQKNFKIDHPLDPANKYLVHAAIESSEVKNLYDGVISLDGNGEAVVNLPEWFQALNRDFRYSLTSIGVPGAGLYIAEEVADNHFRIAGGAPGSRVSWQVTGVRNDAYMQKHPMKVELEKSELERGHYLQPELHQQPDEKSVDWLRQPEFMQRVKEIREKSKRQ